VNAIETLQAGLPGKLAGVGVGVPGFILMDQGSWGAPNLPHSTISGADETKKLLGAKVLENDANAAALGRNLIARAARSTNLSC
jgi:predicted NBD/HSP70 family sugar kinase